jgi:uncharacterized repeat protein (TIGR01451 family)
MKTHNLIKIMINIFTIAGILALVISGSVGIRKALADDTEPPVPIGTESPPQQAITLAPGFSINPSEIVSVQSDVMVTVPITITNTGVDPLEWALDEGNIHWMDNFDSYDTNTSLHGVGGWEGWYNEPAATAYTRNTYSRSAPNSVELVGVSDLVHQYSGVDADDWVYTAWQYIPTEFTGETYFILLNQYDVSGVLTNWSVQVDFNGTTNQVVNTGITGGMLPLIKGQWVELRVEIDLTNDVTRFFYNDQQLYQGTWTEEVSGGGILNLAAMDLWANNVGPVYYDDISLVQLMDVAWLSVSPASGTTAPGESDPVQVTLDATGLGLGEYQAALFASTNDPMNPFVAVPVTMTVLPESDLGISISDTPDPVSAGELITYTLSVNNVGPDGAMGVTVVDTLPGGTTFDHASAGCVEAGGIVTCDVGTLASGASAEITIVVMAPSTGGGITNSATVGGDVIDANTGNNTDSEVTTVTSAFYITFLSIVMK